MSESNPEDFFNEVLRCFKIDSFKEKSSIDMLLVLEDHWYNFLIKTKEFGIIKDINQMEFFVCTTSKSGIALNGSLNDTEINQLDLLKKLYAHYFNLNMNEQGVVLNKFFPEKL